MSTRQRAGTLRKVVDLRDRRVELARAEVAAAQAAVTEAEAAVAARDERIASHDRNRAAVDGWLTGGRMTDARYVESALARREAVLQAKVDDLAIREQEAALLAQAEARRAEAMQALALAQAKRDASQDQLNGARKALDAAREERAQVEFEDRGGRALRLVQGGLS